jgi:hypothetical protein
LERAKSRLQENENKEIRFQITTFYIIVYHIFFVENREKQ